MSQIVAIAALVIISIIGSVLTFSVTQQQQVSGQEAFTAELSGDDELPPVNTESNGTITIQGNNQSLNPPG